MKSLLDYVMRFPVVDKELCENIIIELGKSEWQDHSMYTFHKGKNIKEKDIIGGLKVTTLNSPNNSLLIESLFNPIQKYITEKGAPFYNSWEGYTPIRYNKYEPGMTMAKHVDHIYAIFENNHGVKKGIPTLSIVGALNDDYEGGEIEMFEDTKIKLNAGEVIIFPSIFLYPHKICEVTQGTRHSFVSWVW